MKKYYLAAIAFLLVCLLTFAACETGKDDNEETSADVTTVEDTTVEETTAEDTTIEDTTAEETTEEETTVEETTKEEETTMPYAGENSGLTRDGTPKKYFTLSFDDGITQDLKIIEILKKYDVHCITFNINTGLYGANWTWVADALGKPGLSHKRFTKAELMTGIYDGYDVEVHTLSHSSLKNYDNNPKTIKREVQNDANNIAKITGIIPVGMAWPGGDSEYTDTTIDLVYQNTDIRFGRGTTATNNFKLPEYFLKWMPTCSIVDGNVMSLAHKFVDAECTEDMLFYVWGHGYELDAFDLYGRLEDLVKMMKEDGDIVLVTNAEFYQLFKDQIPAWKDAE